MSEPAPELSEELREEFQKKKQEVGKRRAQLREVTQRKEQAFQEGRSLHDKLRSLQGTIRKLRQERDQSTLKIKELKQQREQLNLATKEKSEERKKVEEKQQQLQQHFQKQSKGELRSQGKGNWSSPARLREQIRFLEQKLETEVMPFEQEKRMRKQLKELKAECQQREQLSSAWKEVDLATADVSEVRHKAQEAHQQIQDLAQQGQRKHEEMQKLLEQGKQLREHEKPLAEKHQQLRAEQQAAKTALEEVEKRLAELRKIFQEEEEKSFSEKVREKTAEVTEKLKTKKKLSMEDILVFQAGKE